MQYIERAAEGRPDAVFLYSQDLKDLKEGNSFLIKPNGALYYLEFVLANEETLRSLGLDPDDNQDVTEGVTMMIMKPQEQSGDPWIFRYFLTTGILDKLLHSKCLINLQDPQVPEELNLPDLEIFLLPNTADKEECAEMLTSLGY